MEMLLEYGSCFETSSAAEDWLLGCALLSLDSLDQTALDLLTAGNSCRPWPEQVGTDRRKCPLTSTTDHPPASGEAAGMYQNGSSAPRAFSKAGSSVASGPGDRATRYPAQMASGALSLVLEAQVQGSCLQAQGRLRNDRLDQADGDGESTVGC